MSKKSYCAFIVLCLIGGFIGLQEFYREKYFLGILSVLFCWTGLPYLVAYIEALVWLFKDENEWNLNYGLQSKPE